MASIEDEFEGQDPFACDSQAVLHHLVDRCSSKIVYAAVGKRLLAATESSRRVHVAHEHFGSAVASYMGDHLIPEPAATYVSPSLARM